MSVLKPTHHLLRLSDILRPHGPIPISRSAWWSGVREGRYPQPVKLGPRTTCWKAEDIEAFIANPSAWGGGR
ncbi:helix-turn-helix transcriptional regulator [Pelagibacterium montanilacus]|uniref:helix-turn-helix transcriptional regulator n=1 Tax=Pelagibacterium montanilacus TaxID=2185280 RepID=UPI000F8E3CAF|nr:AlpA family phage regulatory protein [Pelagibacterium montanilacus]